MTTKYENYIALLNAVFNERKAKKRPYEKEWAEAILHHLGPGIGTDVLDTAGLAGSAAAGAAVGGVVAVSSTSLLTSIGVALGVVSSPIIAPAIAGGAIGVAAFSIGKKLFKRTRKRSLKSLEIEGTLVRAGDLFLKLKAVGDDFKIESLKNSLVNDRPV